MGEREDQVCQVVFPSRQMLAQFEAWLGARGLCVFRIPIEGDDDLPTYGIRVLEDHAASVFPGYGPGGERQAP